MKQMNKGLFFAATLFVGGQVICSESKPQPLAHGIAGLALHMLGLPTRLQCLRTSSHKTAQESACQKRLGKTVRSDKALYCPELGCWQRSDKNRIACALHARYLRLPDSNRFDRHECPNLKPEDRYTCTGDRLYSQLDIELLAREANTTVELISTRSKNRR